MKKTRTKTIKNYNGYKKDKDNQKETKQKCPRYSYVESPIRAWDADKETRYFSCILRKQIFLRSTSFAYICIYETIRSVWKIQWNCLFYPFFGKFFSLQFADVHNFPIPASLQKCVFRETICAKPASPEKVTNADFFAGPFWTVFNFKVWNRMPGNFTILGERDVM